MASSVQGVSCIRKKECRDVLSGHWSATRSCSRILKDVWQETAGATEFVHDLLF